MNFKLCGIYAISDSVLSPNDRLCSMCEKLCQSGKISLFQYREKQISDEQYLAYAIKLYKICEKYNVIFVINDRIAVAKNLESKGLNVALHVGKDECEDAKMLKRLKADFKGIIGVSCYGDISRAVSMEEAGAHYVAFGSCFASSSKRDAKVIDLEILHLAKQKLHIPICAIGGINEKNIDKVQIADMIAMISGIWKEYMIE